MHEGTMRWILSSGLVATGLTGCADPCSDDGLLQDDVTDCAAMGSAGESDTETTGETVTASDGTDTIETDSAGGGDCEDGMQSGDETDVDCGGSCSEACDDGEGCMVDDDCMSDDCGADDICQPSGDTDGEPVTYCEDADEDGFGDPDTCMDVPPGEDPPDGSVPNGDDCADDNPNAYPGAAEEEPELCAQDEDDDGYGDASPPDGVDPGTDCVDVEASIYPGAAEMEPELCTADADDDGYGDDSATEIDPGADDGTDCADDNANAYPGSAPNDSPTACLEDEDDDDYGDADPPEGVGEGTDCNDTDPDVPFVVVGIPDDCETAELLDGSLGCEFYATALSNYTGGALFELLLANAHPVNTASVTVEELIGGVWTPVVGPVDISPESQIIEPVDYNASSSTSIRTGGAYRIVSDVPIAAYQASILQFTSDASLLIPTASWDLDYDVVGYDGASTTLGEYVSVVASEDGTDVTITPTVPIFGGGGVPAIGAGASETIILDQGDTVVMMSNGTDGTSAASMSGTQISASAPVGVFTGSECTNIPGGSPYCDHLEEMQTPTNTASNTVVASRMPPRGAVPENAIWQIYAVEDTTVSFEAQLGVLGLPAAPVDLLAGESIELQVTGTLDAPGDFVAEGTAPIIVSQFLGGSTTVALPLLPGTASGDPAHVIMPGASQLLEAYVVSTVSGNAINHLTITRQIGSEAIDLDGAEIAAGDFGVITDEWEVARIEIAEGSHVLTSADPFAVVVSGYNQDNSYAYLGGGQARALVCE